MFRLELFALILASVLAISLTEGYDGYKIYEIVPKSQAQCDLLYDLSQHEETYDFLTLSKLPGTPARVMVSPDLASKLIDLLRQESFTEIKVLNENVGKSIEQDFNVNRLLRSMSPFSGRGRLTTDRYYSHAEINNYIEDLATRFPHRVHVKTVGKSYQRRNIKTITISNGDGRSNKKVIFMDGGFHAREWISPAAVLYVIDQLVENFQNNADLLLDTDWVIVPVVNPDGYEHTQSASTARMWRKTRQPYKFLSVTCYGADPNRNFGFHWNEGGASSTPCMDTYTGPKAFSEPETIIIRDLMHSLNDRGIMYLTLHSYGNYLLYPWGYIPELPDKWEDLDEVAHAGGDAILNATGTEYTVGSAAKVLYIASGGSDDYAFAVGFPISITMELSGGGVTGFDPPASKIDEYVKETWIGIHAMAKKVMEKY